MIHEHFQVTGTHVVMLDYSDLFGITSHGDDVQRFDTIRTEMITGDIR